MGSGIGLLARSNALHHGFPALRISKSEQRIDQLTAELRVFLGAHSIFAASRRTLDKDSIAAWCNCIGRSFLPVHHLQMILHSIHDQTFALIERVVRSPMKVAIMVQPCIQIEYFGGSAEPVIRDDKRARIASGEGYDLGEKPVQLPKIVKAEFANVLFPFRWHVRKQRAINESPAQVLKLVD